MHRVVSTIRGIAREEAQRRWHPAHAVVTSVHGRNGEQLHACTVKLRETGLVLPKVPIAVGLIGMAALPQVGDLVLVAFAGGDLHAPVVVGRLYSEQTAPPEHDRNELVAWLPGASEGTDDAVRLAVRTPEGGPRKVEVLLDGNVRVEIRLEDERLLVAAGEAKLELTQSGGSDGKASLTVGQASIVVEQGGDVTVEAGGTLTLKGTKVEISGDATVKVAGQTIQLN